MNIVDVRTSGSHSLIIGDTGYAIASLNGPLESWVRAVSRNHLVCIAPKSIVDTPHGVALLMRDGLYVVNGPNVSGPFGREFFVEIEADSKLSLAVARYDQNVGEYLICIPGSEGVGVHYGYAMNMRTRLVRRVTMPSTSNVKAFATEPSGHTLIFTSENIWRFESAIEEREDDDTPLFRYETGFHHLIRGEHFQKVRRVGIRYYCDGPGLLVNVAGFPSGFRATCAEGEETAFPATGTEMSFAVCGIDMPPDYSHSISFAEWPDRKDGSGVSRMKIDKVYLEIVQQPPVFN